MHNAPAVPRRTPFVFAILALAACRPLGPTRWSAPASRGSGRTVLQLEASHSTSRAFVPYPNLTAEYRRGVADRVDVGGRLSVLGAALDTRYALLRGDQIDSSLGLGARASLLRPDWHDRGQDMALEPRFRVGANLSPRVQLGFETLLAVGYARERVGLLDRNSVYLAPTLALALDVQATRNLHLVTELGVTGFVNRASFDYPSDRLRTQASFGFWF